LDFDKFVRFVIFFLETLCLLAEMVLLAKRMNDRRETDGGHRLKRGKPLAGRMVWNQGCRSLDRMRRDVAFTLIELLVVIAIMAILAAMIFPAMARMQRIKRIARAQVELAQVQSFIEAYKAKKGFYPPDSRSPINQEIAAGLNQLYYELDGTTFIGSDTFADRDHSSPALTTNMIKAFFGPGVAGFVNADRGSSEEGALAQKFLNNARPGLVTAVTLSNETLKLTVSANILVCTVPGIDPNKPALNNGSPALNPWRYNSSLPTNNPSSYDLWADIVSGSEVIRICNWNSRPISLP
jgi:prepilin-type N-terminal cleavage/methylation domain-containing protein